jgi:hypothetical protein
MVGANADTSEDAKTAESMIHPCGDPGERQASLRERIVRIMVLVSLSFLP